MTIAELTNRVGYYFNLMPDQEDEREIVDQISSGVNFRGAQLWVLIFAIFIASLGLNINSTAVIIGAMLTGVINQGMSLMGIETNWQKVVKGVVLLVAVIFDVVSKNEKK